MRVLLVAAAPPHLPRGGADHHVAEMARWLPSLGVQVRVLVSPSPEVSPLPGVNFWRSFRGSPTCVQELETCLDEFRPDLTHFHTLNGLGVQGISEVILRKIPALYTAHDLFSVCARTHGTDRGDLHCSGPRGGWRCGGCASPSPLLSPLFALRHHFLEGVLGRCSQVVVPSRYAYDFLVDAGIPSSRLRVLPGGVEAPVEEQEAPGKGFRIVYLGDLRYEKGPDLLVEAFAESMGTLEIWGGLSGHTTPERQRYRRELEHRAGQVGAVCKGGYDPSQLPWILAGAHMVVVPSRVRETYGRAAAEALIRGIPVVAANSGALREQVQEGVNGTLFPVGDVQGLKRAMVRVGDGKFLPREKWPKVFSAEEGAKELLELYREVGERKGGTRGK